MNPYETLGVLRDATDKDLKAAYRRAVKNAHPDGGGDTEQFRRVQEAFDVLIDPARRERYDTTGRTDPSKVTPERIRQFIRSTFKNVVSHRNPNGSEDDPTRVNVKEKLLTSLINARMEIQNMRYQTQRKIEKTTRLLERFKPNKGSIDYVGDALRDELAELDQELMSSEDALEMSQEVERVLRTYGYEVGLETEGQGAPRPTRLSPISRTYY